MPRPELPPVTDAHRREAFARLRWRGWTYEAACADTLRARVIEAYATQLRTRQWQAEHRQTSQLVRRCDPATGAWCSQRVAGSYEGRQRNL